MAAPRALFVAGAGTEIGKTYVTAALTRALVARGCRVRTLKPLASGVPPLDDPAFGESDTARLLAAQGLPVTPETVAACSPWRFLAPLAPDLAAAREGRSVSLDALAAWCREKIAEADAEQNPDGPLVVIEGVGGLMSPVSEAATGLDWVQRLRLPVLLVSGSYLGAVSHALTAIEALRARALPLAAVAVSESADAPTPPGYVASAIGRHAGVPAHIVPRGGGCPPSLLSALSAGLPAARPAAHGRPAPGGSRGS